ncbi:GTP 3',8-cyclase MoaA [Actinoalloteichus sp. AHMU CJ021]|uniref:GTP 3',8-cyclase n=1 Tax=Actinoalloteichus caeruleus DSM 43889 TaxID=1120930 RepID=A0ABT1JJ86_ACTCY|nr:GTP 3',8-cyclase MoaA [Actinoalloteichus caeruleus]AUS78458.1 GTP 3',8-cyclase MoaA [Actinoalloteichus sp. AHMU CJ021]MCP2332553.1 cyclic pyranopterin phosphate synthase [Actinoalloteichus caeruleus DSM 43889]
MTAVDLGMPRVPRSRDLPPRPGTPELVDRYQRVATDLRVSLIDKCNLRCHYCMPAEGLDWLPARELLTTREVVRLVRIAVERLGVTELRFTGGEPLLRPDLEEIVAAAAALSPRPGISLTTNGISLRSRAAALAAAGLDRVNVSLDSVRPETFRRITRRDRLADVLDGLASAAEAGLRPVKVNAVLLPGVNEHEAVELVRFCLAHGYEPRFIEQMPLDAQHGWDRSAMVTADRILELLSESVRLTPATDDRGSTPAERWLVDGGPGTVGVIASVTRPFCGACDRTRLTADGQLRSCLFSQEETDLRALVRAGADDDGIAAAWREAMWGKPAGHGIDDEDFVQPQRPMSAIGG